MDDARAWGAGVEPRRLARTLHVAHDRYVDTGTVAGDVRPLIARSWARSVRSGVDPETVRAPTELEADELDEWRLAHPLAVAMPMVRRLLGDDASDAGLLVAVSDDLGRLLWVEGPPALCEGARAINFTAGARWSESRAGTNAPGTALALDQPVQVFAAEHLSRQVVPWSCTAAPIHDPDTGLVLGALDVTGGDEAAAPHALPLIRATVAAVEGELRFQRMRASRDHAPSGPSGSEGWRLQVLGRSRGVLHRRAGTRGLRLRHAELLTLLSQHPEGLTGEQLALGVHEHDVSLVTVRAEISRLRALVAPVGLGSRPYRLTSRLDTDIGTVRGLLAQGRFSEAVDLYRGPLLPTSDAPGIAILREQLHHDVRTALLEGGDAEALLRFATAEHGVLDWDLWESMQSVLPHHSPRLSQVRRHLESLQQALGPG